MFVRKFTANDFQAIADIYNQSIADGTRTMDGHLFSADDIAQLTAKFCDREIILVGEQDGHMVGWGIIKRYSDRLGYRVCCETSIYLSLAETGQGYGSILQASLLKQVAEFGYHHVVAKILASNPKSVEFHQRFGFEIVGVQKEIGYRQGRWHDMVILQYILPEVAPFCPELG